jgi:hypothetical protein
MGGWLIRTSKEKEGAYLNLSQRNLIGEVFQDMDNFASINEAIIGPACDPHCQKDCDNPDGFAFDGEKFRKGMRQASEFLESHPDWTAERKNWSDGKGDREVGLTIFSRLGQLEGEIIFFYDHYLTGRGICPEESSEGEADPDPDRDR